MATRRIAIFQARTTSSRLPAKVMCAGLPMRAARKANSSYDQKYVTPDGKKTFRPVFETPRKQAMGVNLVANPVFVPPRFKALTSNFGPCLESEQDYADDISLPMFPASIREQRERTADTFWRSLT